MEAMDDIIEIDDDRFSEGSESVSDNSDEDPSYTALDEMSSKLSQLSVTKKPKRRVVEETEDVVEVDEAEEIGEVDEKSFEEVQRIVGAGKIEKLKVEQCKVYLRKNRLRLTGNKATLIERIKEHLEISNGGGEKKYPISSFVMNCKGDACTGDVVLFEQNVYDMFNIASRSATGPPCGTRMVAGRIVKESYGAAKQQHTFTVEVLWSKGEKPLPPLHPLLIKGRNLYRLKTMRQKWEDEDERRKKLMEKHARGSLARSNREARIEKKEKRKKLRENRVSRWEPNKSQPEFESTLVPKPSLQPQRSSSSDNSRNTENQAIGPMQSEIPSKPAITAHHTSLATNYGQPTTKHQPHQKPGLYMYHDKVTEECQSKKDSVQDKYIDEASQSFVGYNRSFSNGHINQPPHPHYKESYYNPGGHIDQTTKFDQRPFTGTNNYRPTSPPRGQHPYGPSRRHYDNNYCPTNPSRSQYGDNDYRPTSPSRRHYSDNNFRPMSPSSRHYSDNNFRPMSPSRRYYSNNNYRPASPSRRQYFVQQKTCRYYARGRCHYGESCKYSHDAME